MLSRMYYIEAIDMLILDWFERIMMRIYWRFRRIFNFHFLATSQEHRPSKEVAL